MFFFFFILNIHIKKIYIYKLIIIFNRRIAIIIRKYIYQTIICNRKQKRCNDDNKYN